jgi:hypothetical protein
MPEHSSMHPYLEWTKQRIDEMDATLASLAAKAGEMQADSRTKAEQFIADLKKRRDAFQTQVKTSAEAGDAALQAAKAQLEAQWNAFETQVKAYFATVGKQIEQQQATFRDIAAAQMKAWHEAADKIHDEASKFAAARRADVEAAVRQMEAEAEQADARLEKVRQAGNESWSALGAALTESRRAFDRANQQAWDALRRAAP